MAIKQPYLVLKQQASTSKKYGTPMTKITLLGIKDRREYITYVDTPHHNYRNWQHVIQNPDHGFIISNVKTKPHKDKVLVDADSKIIIDWEDTSDEEMMRQISELWAEEDSRRGTDKFRDLFK